MSYAATRWLSVAAVQASVTDEESVAVACSAPGAVGGEVSVAGSTVVTASGALSAEMLPRVSLARTVKE